MNWHRVRAIVSKDIRQIAANKLVLIPMIVVPLLICILIPAGLTVAGLVYSQEIIDDAGVIEQMLPVYSVPAELTELSHQILFVFLNYLFLPLFMIVPLMVSSIMVANSVVGEKERKTLETLLYTPVTNREFATGKFLSAFIPAVVVGLTAFVGYFLAINAISYFHSGILLLQSLVWIPAILVLLPAVAIVGLATTLIVSFKAKTFMEAQQLSGLLVLPFVALLIVQIVGLVVVSTLFVVLLSAGLALVGWILIRQVAARFNRENIISTL